MVKVVATIPLTEDKENQNSIIIVLFTHGLITGLYSAFTPVDANPI